MLELQKRTKKEKKWKEKFRIATKICLFLIVETLTENKMRVDGGLVNWLMCFIFCMKYSYFFRVLHNFIQRSYFLIVIVWV